MTEYGRGPGSEPWHPEDPLYGDGGWGGQEAHAAQSPYGGQPQHYPQQPQQQQQYDNGGWNNGQQVPYDQGQQQYPPQYGDQGQQGQQQYPGQGQPQQPYGNGGWDNSGQQGQVPYNGDPADPYGGQPGAYPGEQSDYYATPEAYPPPEPPARRRAEPEPQTDWDPGPDQGEHAFFAGGGDDGDDDQGGRGDRRGRGGKSGKSGKGGKKRRSGCACLVVVLVFGGGLGGAGYFGYQFYQNRFGTAPDYSGDGTTEKVTVVIAKGAFGSVIGQKLKEAGVVKSVDAFVAAQAKNPDGEKIQAGSYLLNKEMSGASAVALMLSPKSKNGLTIYEGQRNTLVYAAIDKRLALKKGTTAKFAKTGWSSLDLPDWANDNKEIKDPLEGFLYPSTYAVAKGMKPKDVLKEMVDLAKEKYADLGIEEKAKDLDLENPLQVLTVASLVQAEGNNKDDFEKVATVVYNRLKINNTETYGLLDFDSTVNYLRGESKLATGSVNALRQINDPYNTYKFKGLPPGPITNPGEVAIKAALNPAKGNWYYFVSLKNKTLFAETNAEQNRNREKYLEEQQKN